MDLSMILKLLIMACGVYMMYWAMQMKTTHKIPEMLVGKGFPLSRAVDPEGFMKKTFPFTLVTGILLFIIGIIGALEVLVLYPIIDTLLMVVLLVELAFYGMFLLKAQKKYLIGVEDEKKEKKKK